MAQFRVGQIYEMGVGTAPDYQAAASWYRKSAEQGNKAAAINLAILYEKGLGVARDATAALNLYRKAQGLSDDLVPGQDARALKETVERLQNRVLQLERGFSGCVALPVREQTLVVVGLAEGKLGSAENGKRITPEQIELSRLRAEVASMKGLSPVKFYETWLKQWSARQAA